MKVNWNTFVKKIVNIHFFLIKANKNNFLLSNWNFIKNYFDKIGANNIPSL